MENIKACQVLTEIKVFLSSGDIHLSKKYIWNQNVSNFIPTAGK
jgi:hypothetical protein